MTNISTLLKLNDVTFSYTKSQAPLLKAINLKICSGEKIGIVGDNGCGKSTLVKLLLGLQHPNRGDVKLFGKTVLWRNYYPQLGYIGDPSFSPGETGLPTGISVGEVVHSFESFWKSSYKSLRSELIERLELYKLFSRDVSKLSNGERKKLMAFLALGKETKLLIADEATEGLDKNAKPIVIDLVKQAAKKEEFAVLWISHRRDEIALLTDKVYELSPDEERKGKLVELPIQGFDCEVEAIGSTSNSGHYQNLNLDGLASTIGEIWLNPSLTSFKVTGTKNISRCK